ncbi:DUF2490 domain-containing protein [Asticcacaulis sp. W401b]|uniref:DUF2490 domain-containing protein n=1 Tax=Asticcacaulis sp. W401b TaxID=3388666 RepID=UPI003970466E
MFRITRLVPLAFGCLLPFGAQAASEDTAVWGGLHSQFKLNDRVSATVEVQKRFNNDASRLGQYLIRPSVSYAFSPTTRGSLGYAFVQTNPPGPAKTDEHRLWQQLTYRVAAFEGGAVLNGRTRLEQRQIDGRDDMGWRLRQQIRFSKPLTQKVTGVVWSEAFWAANTTDWGQREGLERWRNSVGVSVPLTSRLTLEPGYIHQWVRRPREDAVDHIVSLSLTAQF